MAKKTLGRKKEKTPAPASKKSAPKLGLSEADLELVQRLAERTSLLPREVIERALAGYAAAVVPRWPTTRH